MTPRSTNCYPKQPLLEQKQPATVINNKEKHLEPDKEKKIKCMLVGDKHVGKTALAVSYSNDTFPDEYNPTMYDIYNVIVEVDGRPIQVEICDTPGTEEEMLGSLRYHTYPGTDVFLLCFSIVDPSSFYSAYSHWSKELLKQEAPVLLVGTQADLKTNFEVIQRLRQNGERPVSESEARGLADLVHAPYIETSAKTCYQLKEAFDLAITVALNRQKSKKKPKFWKKLCCGLA